MRRHFRHISEVPILFCSPWAGISSQTHQLEPLQRFWCHPGAPGGSWLGSCAAFFLAWNCHSSFSALVCALATGRSSSESGGRAGAGRPAVPKAAGGPRGPEIEENVFDIAVLICAARCWHVVGPYTFCHCCLKHCCFDNMISVQCCLFWSQRQACHHT